MLIKSSGCAYCGVIYCFLVLTSYMACLSVCVCGGGFFINYSLMSSCESLGVNMRKAGHGGERGNHY